MFKFKKFFQIKKIFSLIEISLNRSNLFFGCITVNIKYFRFLHFLRRRSVVIKLKKKINKKYQNSYKNKYFSIKLFFKFIFFLLYKKNTFANVFKI